MLIPDIDPTAEEIFIGYLLRETHKINDIVVIEGCKSICELPNISTSDLEQTVALLTIFLTGINTVNKYAALKILNKVNHLYSLIRMFKLIYYISLLKF